ncbi:MAG: aminotransferase class V-fold PLP-dependent enzyme [Armatimonadetes bacterium]|nr:aminotransferase class V-fold PLP-dependent enzyme [Armatimonadota bacterium]
MSLDVKKARKETPGTRNVAHFNNAGASLMPLPVTDAVKAYLQLESDIGGYEAAAKSAEQIGAVYQSVARLLNANPAEIALMESATRAWDMAFYALDFKPGERILTASNEYASNFIAFLQARKRYGVDIGIVENDEHGQISLEALREAMDERVKLVALTHVATNDGLVQPAEEVGKIVKEAGALYLLDACQSAGQLCLDVRKIQCDFLSATGRKYLRGPRGTGFLYVKREMIEKLEPPLLDLQAANWVSPDSYEIRGDARRFEAFESSLACRMGLGAAVDYALGWGMEAIQERIAELATALRSELSKIPGITVHDRGERKGGIVTFASDRISPSEIQDKLRSLSINVAVTQARHTRLDMEARRLDGLVRASVHYFNTEDEIARLGLELARIQTAAAL